LFNLNFNHSFNHSFETRPGPVVDLGLESGRVDEKIGKVMTQCDPTDPVTLQNPVATR
jgi:hypothetical protein